MTGSTTEQVNHGKFPTCTCLRFGEKEKNGKNAEDSVDLERKTKEKRQDEIQRRNKHSKRGGLKNNMRNERSLGRIKRVFEREYDRPKGERDTCYEGV